ncbi:epimerase [Candidatus Uhrbacteria bacterium RIFCSPHIGHO2_12_FULL_57_11]|uniref:Epimerase n=1 Tax=Candidatus Uhrbacteria bacterium RIFCSPHIGHO2_12_FULL_57_11 TaxID=1802398 RepID=A0A1F7UHP5_9BACT|nr:MAG: epimerase [Candidatus Uhrbacteria bacterium RIFCSPHIGHO2_12_FULL_57_11]
MKILVTGGAGYFGSVLVPELLRAGHSVTVLDSLLYGGTGLLQNFGNRNFRFIRGDVRDEPVLRQAADEADVIIHLAAIVGYQACRKDERLAEEVNLGGTRNVAAAASSGQTVIFASTGSNYGAVDGVCTEETPLQPLSVYGRTKTEAEHLLLQSCPVVAYRFATAFGISPRLRLDLMINDFVYQALKTKNLIVYEKNFRRTFIHVCDMARAIRFALDHLPEMRGQVYNVGGDSMNLTKEDVARKLREKVEFYLHFAEVGKDEDQRNYEVSYKKIRDLGFDVTISLDEGLDELIRGMQVVQVTNPYSNVYF